MVDAEGVDPDVNTASCMFLESEIEIDGPPARVVVPLEEPERAGASLAVAEGQVLQGAAGVCEHELYLRRLRMAVLAPHFSDVDQAGRWLARRISDTIAITMVALAVGKPALREVRMMNGLC